jgi:tellurite resistance protein TerC
VVIGGLYISVALALVLVFIGVKIFLVGVIGKIPPVIPLTVTFGLILGGVLFSLYKTRDKTAAATTTS